MDAVQLNLQRGSAGRQWDQCRTVGPAPQYVGRALRGPPALAQDKCVYRDLAQPLSAAQMQAHSAQRDPQTAAILVKRLEVCRRSGTRMRPRRVGPALCVFLDDGPVRINAKTPERKKR